MTGEHAKGSVMPTEMLATASSIHSGDDDSTSRRLPLLTQAPLQDVDSADEGFIHNEFVGSKPFGRMARVMDDHDTNHDSGDDREPLDWQHEGQQIEEEHGPDHSDPRQRLGDKKVVPAVAEENQMEIQEGGNFSDLLNEVDGSDEDNERDEESVFNERADSKLLLTQPAHACTGHFDSDSDEHSGKVPNESMDQEHENHTEKGSARGIHTPHLPLSQIDQDLLSSSSDESDGIETDLSDLEVRVETPLMERRAKRIRRNTERLEALGFGGSMQPRSLALEVGIDENAQPDKDVHQENTGMLFPTRHAAIKNPGMLLDVISPDEDIALLDERYPFRELQIKLLVSLIGETMSRTMRSAIGGQVFDDVAVPPPLLVTGPTGVGKTTIVRDVLDTLKHHHLTSAHVGSQVQRIIGSAYVNCATIEPASMIGIVENSYAQIMSSVKATVSRQRRHRHRRKRRVVDTNGLSESIDSNCGVNAHGLLERQNLILDSHETEYDNDNEAEMEDRIETHRAQLSQANQIEHVENPRLTKGLAHSRHSRTAKAQAMASHSPIASSEHPLREAKREVESAHVSYGAPVALGRALAPFFGKSSKYAGCAFLILDQAERLLSLSSSSNYLAQMLLLPKVMGLNLTIIAITGSNLLDCSRSNNGATVEKALGTMSNAIRPIRIHFPAYSGIATFKAILMQPDILQLVVGNEHSRCNQPQHGDEHSVVSSFVATLVQSLSSVTRDLREMIRIGRMLWPIYILPLHPTRMDETLRLVRARIRASLLSKSTIAEGGTKDDQEIFETNEKIQQELRVVLDESMRPRMSCMNENLFVINQSATVFPNGTEARARGRDIHTFPYLSKCILLAAFICQHNRPDKDKKLFTIQRNGKKNGKKGHAMGGIDSEGIAYGTTSKEMQQLKMLRPRSFALERMLSVFVNIVGLNQNTGKLLTASGEADITEILGSMGSKSFYDSLAQLREIGLLREVAGAGISGDRNGSFDVVNMSSTKYWCDVTRDDAEELAVSIDFPLSRFLL